MVDFRPRAGWNPKTLRLLLLKRSHPSYEGSFWKNWVSVSFAHEPMKPTILLLALLLPAGPCLAAALSGEPLPDTRPLPLDKDRSATMVGGIDQFLMAQIRAASKSREAFWHRDLSSPAAYSRSVETNRAHLRTVLGVVDPRPPVKELIRIETTRESALVGETPLLKVWAVRWPAMEGVFGEGLLLEPTGSIRARVVAIPDADQTPEQIAGLAAGVAPTAPFGKRLAELGCQVLIPVLASRQDDVSGNSTLQRFTNQPHREWIYRQAFEMGRHVIGYEVQKILAAVDWFSAENQRQGTSLGIGVMGYAEGGLLALHAAALDERITATVVSGYFENRDRLWAEPIYRNLFGVLREFADADIASLIAPRALILEHSSSPEVTGPPPPRAGRRGAAPGVITTPQYASVEDEWRSALDRVPARWATHYVQLINGSEGTTVEVGSDRTLVSFVNALGIPLEQMPMPGPSWVDRRSSFDPARRQAAQVDEMVQFTQRLMRRAQSVRDARVASVVKSMDAATWTRTTEPLRQEMWDQVIGRFPAASQPANPRSRRVYDEATWVGYDVVLDVWPGVFAWGVMLLPKDLKPGERRPVVVCQHGLERVPYDTITPNDPKNRESYNEGFASRLAERGFVVFSPHNPYRGEDRFRVLQRKANPLGRSLFSVILAQHDRILDWLSEQPFVDPKRIGFYGISYGGKTAMRVPALLDRYCLSICSADFNEWIQKNVTVDSGYSYLFTNEYEMPEFNLGNTFNYAEMAALIAPRPFMVERGHDDGVAPDDWVAAEYARVRRRYAKLGIPEKTEIEFFNGPHSIHGQGTFRFLHKHLNWPEPRP